VTEAHTGSGKERPSGGGWLKAFLVLSLAANLLVAGTVAGSLWSGSRAGSRAGGTSPQEISLFSFSSTLPPERRRQIRKELRAQQRNLAPLREGIRAARREAAAVLESEPFDASRLRDAFGRIDEAETRLKAAAREVLITTAEKMSPEERKSLGAWWQERKAHLFRVGPGDGSRPRRERRERPAPP